MSPFSRAADALVSRASGLAVANVVAQVAIIVTGGAVRLSGSGLGCSTAPKCEPDSFLPDLANLDAHTAIEFGNRLATVVLGIIALAMAIAVWRASRELRWWGLVPVVGVFAQAVLGAITVRVDLDPRVVGPHMLLSIMLVWVSTWIALRLKEYRPRAAGPSLVVHRWASLVLFAALAFLGVLTTATGPHSGDADQTERLALDHESISRAHALPVWLFVVVVGLIAFSLWRRRAEDGDHAARASVVFMIVATLAQGAVGYIQYFNGLPALVVGIHLLGIGVFTVAHSAMFALTQRARALRVATH